METTCLESNAQVPEFTRLRVLDVDAAWWLPGLDVEFVPLKATGEPEDKKGQGMQKEEEKWGRVQTPWGSGIMGWTTRGLFHFSFGDPQETKHPLLKKTISLNPEGNDPVRLRVSGTPFQIRVWQALLCIPRGRVVSYSQIANACGVPGASRAVGTACGANPVAYYIPCHRVVRSDGALGGYRWGLAVKKALLAYESQHTIGA